MTTLTYVDRFILALWKRNDQLSVYNPGLKTQYDTYSWVKDFGGTEDPVWIKKHLDNYKKDLLASLTYDDTFPMSFSEGKFFIERFVGKDVRNMSKWLRNQYGELKDKKMTYEKLYSEYIDNPQKSLGSRSGQAQDTSGFREATFVEMVEEKFMYGMFSRPESVFGTSREDDMSKFGSSYFWFMYGILPRKNITYLEIKEGLFADDKDENMVKIEKTITFLGLVFNIQAPSVRFVIKNPIGEGNKESETFKFINTYSEIPYPLDAKVELRPLRIDEENKIGHINITTNVVANPQENPRIKQLEGEIKNAQESLTKWRQDPRNVGWNVPGNPKKIEFDKRTAEIAAKKTTLKNERNKGQGRPVANPQPAAPAGTPSLSKRERRADQLSVN